MYKIEYSIKYTYPNNIFPLKRNKLNMERQRPTKKRLSKNILEMKVCNTNFG